MLLIYKLSFEISWFRFDGSSKTRLFHFSFVHFYDFLTSFAKNLMKKPPVFITDIKSSHKFYSLANIWDLQTFDKETTAISNFLEICTETHFCCLFSLTGKIIGILCLLIDIKCLVSIYFIENYSFAKRPFPNYGSLKMVFHFFRFFTFCFHGIFVKNFLKKLSLFNANF